MENPLEIIGLRLVRIEQLLEDLILGKSNSKKGNKLYFTKGKIANWVLKIKF